MLKTLARARSRAAEGDHAARVEAQTASGRMGLRALSYGLVPELLAEGGPVAIHPDDRAYGALAAGVQGVGKSSLLLRLFANDLLDANAAQIVMDPKPELVERCLEVIPPDCRKEVWYLDLSDPAFGMNPLRVYRSADFATEVAAVGESIVAALLALNEGQIYQSSRRYLYPAVIGALAIARAHPQMHDALLEHVYALLRPQEREMHQVAAACCQRLGLEKTARFFSKELPEDLQISPQRTSDRMDAPANKVTGLLDKEPLRRFFQHPYDVSLSEIIERRGILLVNAGRGRIGTENARACMSFIFQMLDRHMQRQMLMAEEQRPRVAVICDEAHYLFSRGVVKQIATHRAAGFDMTAGIQYLSQLGADAESTAATREIRDGVANLLQSKFMFRVSDPGDADEISRIAMAVVSTMTQQDPDSRIQRRITPEVMMNIGNHFCVASGIAAGSRMSAFIGRTYRMEKVQRGWAEHHLQTMRQRLGPEPEDFVRPIAQLTDAEALLKAIGTSDKQAADTASRGPTMVPPTMAQGKKRSSRRKDPPAADQPSEHPERAARLTAPAAGDRTSPADQHPDAAGLASGLAYGPVPVRRLYTGEPPARDPHFDSPVLRVFGSRMPEQPEPQRGPAPASLRDLTIVDRLLGVGNWRERAADKETPKLADVDLAILKLLYRGGVLLAPLIARACMPGKAERTVRYRLGKLHEGGLIARGDINVRDRARNEAALPSAYKLTAAGFKAAQRHGVIDPDREWRPVDVGARGMTVPHDQHAIGWVTQLARLMGDRVVTDNWRTPRSAHGTIAPPTVGDGRRRHQLTPIELNPPASAYGYDGAFFPASPNDRFAELKPDATVEIRIPGQELRFDLLLELTLAAKPSHNQAKLAAYDSFLLGWWREHRRYRHLRSRPVVVFVLADEHALRSNAELADRQLDGRIGMIGLPQHEWWHPAREHIFFALEEDIHYGSLRCYAIPALPRSLREALGDQQRLLRECRMLPESMVTEGRL